MVHPGKTLLLQVGRGLLTADATGAEHRNRPGLALLNQRPELPLHPLGKLAKSCGARINRTLKAADRHLVGVAGVNHQGVGVGDQGIPLPRGHVGAHLRGQIGTHLGLTHGHDLALEPHFEPVESLNFRAAELGFQPLQACHLPQPSQQRLHASICSGNRAVYPLSRQQDRAAHPLGCCQVAQLTLQVWQALKGGEAIKRRHQHTHPPTCTPAAARSSRSASTAGLEVVSRVSP